MFLCDMATWLYEPYREDHCDIYKAIAYYIPNSSILQMKVLIPLRNLIFVNVRPMQSPQWSFDPQATTSSHPLPLNFLT